MTARLSTGAFLVAFLCVCLISSASAEDTYTLKYTTEPGQFDYIVDSRATFNIHADDLPLPGAYIDIRNIELHTRENRWVKVESYDQATDCITMSLGGTPEWIRFGYDFFQLPPMDELIKQLKEENIMGDELDFIKNPQSQVLTLKISPKGKFMGLDFNLPDEYTQEMSMFMPIVINTISNMIDPAFPDKAVKIGDSWSQNVKLDKIPVAGLPTLTVNYLLKDVEKNDQGDMIGNIQFDCKWHYDVKLPENIVQNEKIPYWKDKKFEIVSLRPSVDFNLDGNTRFNITKGMTVSCDYNTEIVIIADADLRKLTGHAKDKIWSPHAEYKVIEHDVMKLK